MCLPTGRWFVGDFVGRREGQDVFLVETVRGRSVAELTTAAIVAAGLPTYARKSSAKRAAQRMRPRRRPSPSPRAVSSRPRRASRPKARRTRCRRATVALLRVELFGEAPPAPQESPEPEARKVEADEAPPAPKPGGGLPL